MDRNPGGTVAAACRRGGPCATQEGKGEGMGRSRLLLLFGCVMLMPAGGAWAKQPHAKPTEPRPGSLADLDSKNGFRDVTFGSEPTKDMELVRVDGDERVYLRQSDSLKVDSAT